MLTGRFKSHADIPSDSLLIQHGFPRFSPEAFEHNRKLADETEAIAKEKGCTPAQLAINWVLEIGRQPGMPKIVPIPGTTTVERVRENAKVVDVGEREMRRIHEVVMGFEVVGDRYP